MDGDAKLWFFGHSSKARSIHSSKYIAKKEKRGGPLLAPSSGAHNSSVPTAKRNEQLVAESYMTAGVADKGGRS